MDARMRLAPILAASMTILALGARAGAAPATTLGPLLASRDWLATRLTAADVKDKVVLVDFYTFDCINCQDVEPNLRALERARSRADLVIVSVHSPETPDERVRANLAASTRSQGVVWPVAIDNDFSLWNAYGVSAWPTQLIFDRNGQLRSTVVGEGQDRLIDDTIARLIADQTPANHS